MSLKSSTQAIKSDKKKIVLFSVIGVAVVIIAIIGLFIYRKYKMYSDAEKVAKSFMTAFSDGDMTTAGNYIFPAMVEHIENTGSDIETYLELLSSDYYAPRYSYNFIEYKVKSAKEYDGADFYDTYEAELREMPSYIKPETFIKVEIELSFNNQTNSVYLELAYCDKKFYFYNIDASGFDMNLDDEVSVYLRDSFANNHITVSGEPEGTRTSFDGFSMIVPEEWKNDRNIYSMSLGETSIYIQDTSDMMATNLHIGSCNEKGYFGMTYVLFKDQLYMELELGSLKTDNLSGYYAKYKAPEDIGSSGSHIDVIYMKNGVVYCVEIYTTDTEAASYEEALKIAGTFMFE